MNEAKGMTFSIPAMHVTKLFANAPDGTIVSVTLKDKTKATVEVSMACTPQQLYDLAFAMGKPASDSQYD